MRNSFRLLAESLSCLLVAGFVLLAPNVVASNPQPLPTDLKFVSPGALPKHASWFSIKRWPQGYPPEPYNWCAGRTDVFYYHSASYSADNIFIDDSTVDYSEETSTPAMATAGFSSATFGPLVSYNSNQFWLLPQMDKTTPNQVDVFTFGVSNALVQSTGISNGVTGLCQLLTNAVLSASDTPWVPGPIMTYDGSTNILVFPIPDGFPADTFFRGIVGTNSAYISPQVATAIEPDGSGSGAQAGSFVIYLTSPNYTDVTVYYTMTGTAQPGIDYTNSPGSRNGNIGSVVVPSGSPAATVTVQPLHDPNLDFDEPAIFTLIPSNSILVKPGYPPFTVTIQDNFGSTNIFEVVSTNLPSPVGIDYDPANQSLILPINYLDNNPAFGIVHTNGILTNWSGIGPLNQGNEVRIFTAKTTTNGLGAGDLLFGNGNPGGIGWLSADGTTSNLNWITIAAEPNLIESIYVDQTGIWSNDVLAVSGTDEPEGVTGLDVWKIHMRTNIQLIATIPTQHLEGLLTLTNSSRYGPWAGKLLTADEREHAVYAVDFYGSVTPYFLGIDGDAVHLIQTNQDLYCVQFNSADSSILKLSRNYLKNWVDDVLIEQSGETPADPELFIVHWNGKNFETHGIDLYNFFPPTTFFEKCSFAPVSMPPVQ